MKEIVLFVFILLSQMSWGQNITNQFVKGEVYVMFTDDYCITSRGDRYLDLEDFDFLTKIKSEFEIVQIEHSFFFLKQDIPRLNNLVRIHFKAVERTTELLVLLNNLQAVEYAERIPINVKQELPNDQLLEYQWYLERINAEAAWGIEQGSNDIDVGVVDDCFYNHNDLWENKELGWDVSNNDGDVRPDVSYSHGTKVAGVVAATTNNVYGVASLGRNIDFIPIKASIGDGHINYGYEGVIRAAQEGAEIINMSWGNYYYSETNEKIINVATDLYGCILVAAAGNDNVIYKEYPAGYENVIAVAASDEYDNKASFSNYGSWVDIVAPGVFIATTSMEDSFVYGSGTSYSSPLVAALLGLVWSVNPQLSKEEVISCVFSSAKPLYWYGSGSGRIDALAAVQCATNPSLLEYKNQITIFPNPTYDFINIASYDDIDADKLLIFDSTGRLVIEYEGNRINKYDVSNFATGNYIVKIITDQKEIMFRFLKSKIN